MCTPMVWYADEIRRTEMATYFMHVKLMVGLEVVVTVVGSEAFLPPREDDDLNVNLTSLRMFRFFDFMMLLVYMIL